jgi:hypothetical protein
MLTDSKAGLQDPALHETLDPTPRETARALGQPLFDAADDGLRARLGRLEAHSLVRQRAREEASSGGRQRSSRLTHARAPQPASPQPVSPQPG